jgi:hypothetical protein
MTSYRRWTLGHTREYRRDDVEDEIKDEIDLRNRGVLTTKRDEKNDSGYYVDENATLQGARIKLQMLQI